MPQKKNDPLDQEYELIPMNEITEDARNIAVRWSENMKDDFIHQKHKLASDIMNYARVYAGKLLATTDASILALEQTMKMCKFAQEFTTELQQKVDEQQVQLSIRQYSETDMIRAAQYGYEFHRDASFPDNEFKDECINNFMQFLVGKLKERRYESWDDIFGNAHLNEQYTLNNPDKLSEIAFFKKWIEEYYFTPASRT